MELLTQGLWTWTDSLTYELLYYIRLGVQLGSPCYSIKMQVSLNLWLKWSSRIANFSDVRELRHQINEMCEYGVWSDHTLTCACSLLCVAGVRRPEDGALPGQARRDPGDPAGAAHPLPQAADDRPGAAGDQLGGAGRGRGRRAPRRHAHAGHAAGGAGVST